MSCIELRLIVREIELTRRAYLERLAGDEAAAAALSARAAELRGRICRLREASHDDARRPAGAAVPSVN